MMLIIRQPLLKNLFVKAFGGKNQYLETEQDLEMAIY